MTEREPIIIDELPRMLITQVATLPERLSRRITRTMNDLRSDFQVAYLMSGISTYIDDYIHRAQIVTVALTVFLSTLSELVAGWAGLSLPRIVLFAANTAVIVMIVTGGIFIIYPYYRKSESKKRLEDGLIYFLSYMTVLSSSGMPIERIIERMTEVEDNPPLVHLGKKFMMNIKLFGMDVRSALKDISRMSPSKTLEKQFEGMRNTITTSGDLKSFLIYEVSRQLQEKKERLKGKLNTLVYLGELYVAAMVLTPTLFILIITILSALGGINFGGGAALQLNAVVFLGIPILGATFTVLLDQTMGREE